MENTLSRTGVYGIAWRDNQLLLIKQQKGPHKGKFDLPGGGIEIGETIEEALKREFEEEVAMAFASIRLFANFTATTPGTFPNGSSYILHQIGLIYVVEGLKPLQTPSAELEHFWIDCSLLHKEPISPFVELVLKQIHPQ